ncbi:MAG: hypothetical protein OEL54_05300 [Flavobacteriaceae bacterium]|nr:hypothetical protein [Flavobacteriaceae bacterium]
MKRTFRIEAGRVDGGFVSEIMEALAGTDATEGALTLEELQIMDSIGVDVETIASHIFYEDADFVQEYDDGKEESEARESALNNDNATKYSLCGWMLYVNEIEFEETEKKKALKKLRCPKDKDCTEEEADQLVEEIEAVLSTGKRAMIMAFLEGNVKVKLTFDKNSGNAYIEVLKKYTFPGSPFWLFPLIFDGKHQTRNSLFEWMLYDQDINFQA